MRLNRCFRTDDSAELLHNDVLYSSKKNPLGMQSNLLHTLRVLHHLSANQGLGDQNLKPLSNHLLLLKVKPPTQLHTLRLLCISFTSRASWILDKEKQSITDADNFQLFVNKNKRNFSLFSPMTSKQRPLFLLFVWNSITSFPLILTFAVVSNRLTWKLACSKWLLVPTNIVLSR